MKDKYRCIIPFAIMLAMIGIVKMPDVATCDIPDTCEYKEWIDVEQTYAFVAHNEKNELLHPAKQIIDKFFRLIPLLLIVPFSIAIIVISFVIFKAIHKLIREMIER